MLTDVVLNPSDPILGIAVELITSVGGHPSLHRLDRGLYQSGEVALPKLIRDPIELASRLPEDLPPVGETKSLEDWRALYEPVLEKMNIKFVVEFFRLKEGLRFHVYEVIPSTSLRAAVEEAKRLAGEGTVEFELCDGSRKRAKCTWVDPWLELFRIKGAAGTMSAKEAVTTFPGLRVIRQRLQAQ